MMDVLDTIERWRGERQRIALATVVGVERSAPPACRRGMSWTTVSRLAGAMALGASSGLMTFIRWVKQKQCR